MKVTKFIFLLAVQIVVLALLMMIFSYLTEFLQQSGFFADVKIIGPKNNLINNFVQ